LIRFGFQSARQVKKIGNMDRKEYHEITYYRLLNRDEIKNFVEIDSAEVVEGEYAWRNGALVHTKRHADLPNWSNEDKEEKTQRYEQEYDRGAIVVGAFLDSVLVGFAITKPIVIVDRSGMFELQQIIVSKDHRKKGVATAMINLTKEKAIEIGAKAISLLSTPAEPAIRLYLSVGFEPFNVPDDAHWSWWDGEDIYMEMML